MWSEHTTAQGRKFYFNSITRVSQWNKPDSSTWTQYFTPEGRPYYHNSQTGESTWNPPEASFEAKQPDEPLEAKKFKPHWPENRAEGAFMQMLADHNVNASWDWDQVLRTTVSHPAYRSIEGVQRKKALWLKYLHLRKQWEREQQTDLDDSPVKEFFEKKKLAWNCRFAEALEAFLHWLKGQHHSQEVVALKNEFSHCWLQRSKAFFCLESTQSALESFKSFMLNKIPNCRLLQVKWREFYVQHRESISFVDCLNAGHNPMMLFFEHLKERRMELASEDVEFALRLRQFKEAGEKRRKLKQKIRVVLDLIQEKKEQPSWEKVKVEFDQDQEKEAKEIFETFVSNQVEEGELLSDDDDDDDNLNRTKRIKQ
jgi:hypothetical protein